MFRWLFLFIIIAIIEIYAFQAFKTLIKTRWILVVYEVISAAFVLYIIWSLSQFDRTVGQNRQSLFTFGLLLVVYVPKMFLMVFMFGEDLFRIIRGITNYFVEYDNSGSYLPERRKFVSQIALVVAAIPFASLIYGIFEGKYNFKVIKQQVFFPDLPDAFDGLKVTQISDIHSGSFDNPDKIQYAIDLINQQQSDLILFTGDIVNTHATEMDPWIETFKGIHTPEFGKFSVLGNHDYGEYITWPTKKQKDDNFKAIKELHSKMDFKLLLNEHTFIEKDNQRIAIVGVENWGKNFKQAGDLRKASDGLSNQDFKILMSHDPSHWEYQVKEDDKHFQLTLSGHTHGMQFGIEIPGFFKWSPVQYVYKQWAGLYENLGRYVYVNRGFGFHAYPGRVGIMPEITVIELKKGTSVA